MAVLCVELQGKAAAVALGVGGALLAGDGGPALMPAVGPCPVPLERREEEKRKKGVQFRGQTSKSFKRSGAAAIALGVAALAAPASAAPVLDFTDSSVFSGTPSTPVAGSLFGTSYTIDATAPGPGFGNNLTFTETDAPDTSPRSAPRGRESSQSVTISFDDAIALRGIDLLDLYTSDNGQTREGWAGYEHVRVTPRLTANPVHTARQGGGDMTRSDTLGRAGAIASGLVAGLGAVAAQAQEETELRWATSSVGSSGHRALTSMAPILDENLDNYSISVLPTPGAAASVRGFATGQFDGYYGADIAFQEIANSTGRYEGFAERDTENQLVQSFWAYTIEVGLGVLAEDADTYQSWTDLSGEPVFTSPAPWDTRAALERAMRAAGVDINYLELDTGLAAQGLQEGTIEGMIVYTSGETSPSPWVQEALLRADIQVLNPSEEEIAAMEEAGIPTVTVSADAFDSDVGVDEAVMVPFFYGFHLGLDVPAEDVTNILTTIQENAGQIAEADPGLSQIADGGMVEMQRRGIQAVGDAVPIHPGLAQFLRDNDAWNSDWDDRVAETSG